VDETHFSGSTKGGGGGSGGEEPKKRRVRGRTFAFQRKGASNIANKHKAWILETKHIGGT